jgi:hypothetical protein
MIDGMRKHRFHWLAAASLLSIVLGASLFTLRQPRPGITRENFDRTEVGMTEDEVEAILGGPPGTYTDRPIVVVIEGVMFRRWWIGDEGVVTIELTWDEPRRVAHKRFRPIPPEPFDEQCSRHWRQWRRRLPSW